MQQQFPEGSLMCGVSVVETLVNEFGYGGDGTLVNSVIKSLWHGLDGESSAWL
jgi:hypothetical protein